MKIKLNQKHNLIAAVSYQIMIFLDTCRFDLCLYFSKNHKPPKLAKEKNKCIQ